MASINTYASAKVYKIIDNSYTMFYYGSTMQQLSKRMTTHRTQYKAFGEGKSNRISVFDIFDAHGVENCKIELVEDCPCEGKEQLRGREGFYIQNNQCVNKNIAGRSLAEWTKDTRDHRLQAQALWRSENPEKVKEIRRRSEARKTCAVCGAVCSRPFGRHKLSKKHVAAEAMLDEEERS
jgi:hypothetical protein